MEDSAFFAVKSKKEGHRILVIKVCRISGDGGAALDVKEEKQGCGWMHGWMDGGTHSRRGRCFCT